MLQRINGYADASGASVKVVDASFPAPFAPGLEFSSPARGTWNIVHTTMLVPGSHQVYICAAGCLRGVVLTAAEAGAMNRFSSIVLEEQNLLDNSMDDLIVDGVGDILARLEKKPKVMFIYPACTHHFIGCDMDSIMDRLRQLHPDVGFSLCWMDPIRRKNGMTAEARTRWQIYSFLQPCEHDPKAVNIIGNNLPTSEDSELVRLIRDNGFTLRDLTLCKTFEDYLAMAKSAVNVSYNPQVIYGGQRLEEDLGQKNLFLPLSFNYDEIIHSLYTLADYLGVDRPDYGKAVIDCEETLLKAKAIIGDTPIAIDYAATFRPMGLARMLLEHDFNVTRIYVDTIPNEDKVDFRILQKYYPDVLLYATMHAKMRVLDRHTEPETLAIGQKAAYFTGTKHFVDIAECGGFYGFSGIRHMARLMVEAFLEEKEARNYIQTKGWGCHVCQ